MKAFTLHLKQGKDRDLLSPLLWFLSLFLSRSRFTQYEYTLITTRFYRTLQVISVKAGVARPGEKLSRSVLSVKKKGKFLEHAAQYQKKNDVYSLIFTMKLLHFFSQMQQYNKVLWLSFQTRILIRPRTN